MNRARRSPRKVRRRRRPRGALSHPLRALLASAAAVTFLGAPALAAPPSPAVAPDTPPASNPPSDPPPAPADPNEAPFMKPPNGQLGDPYERVELERVTPAFSPRRRVSLTISPSFASFKSPFLGRRERFHAGGGAEMELDVRIVRWLWLRALGSYTVHPVAERNRLDDEGTVIRLANAGTLQAGQVGISGVYPLDLGRFLPQLDAGVGVLWVKSPPAAVDGQLGAPCRTGNVCDFGLRCGAQALCEVAPQPEIHIGVAVDYLIGKHWTVGAHFRYFALLTNLQELGTSFPAYLQLGLRLAVRF